MLKRPLRSMRGRLAFLLAVLAGLTALAVGLAGYRLTAHRFSAEIRESLDRFAVELQADEGLAERACFVNRRGGAGDFASVALRNDPVSAFETAAPPSHSLSQNAGRNVTRRGLGRRGQPPGLVTQCLTASGEVTLEARGFAIPITGRDKEIAKAATVDRYARKLVLNDREFRLVTVGLPGGGAIQIARELSENDRVLGDLVKELSALVIGATLLAGLAGLVVANRTIRPLQALTNTAENIALTGELNAVLPPAPSSDETGRLTRAFGAMVDALRTSRLQQSQLVHDASHELRTPLTSLRANISLLKRHPDLDPARRDAIVSDLDEELRELTDLLNELVALASDETAREEAEEFDPQSLVEDTIDRWRRRSAREISLRSEGSGDSILLLGRPKLFARAVSNIVSNAVKFSPAGSALTAALSFENNEVVFHVDDAGSGFAPGETTRVFDRFYRSDIHRPLPGSGLGLAIVAAAAEDLGGTAVAENNPAGGGRVTLRLPRPRQ